MRKAIRSLSEIIREENEFERLRKITFAQEILDKFGELFPKLKSFVTPVKYENGILYLKVENSVWRSELQFNQKTFVERINKTLESDEIKSIKFVK